MPESGFFMAIGALGVSFAGFAGVISAFDDSPEGYSAVAAWRLRNLVLDSFTVMMTGFGVVAFHSVTEGDLALAIRLASVFWIIRGISILHPSNSTGPAWDGSPPVLKMLSNGSALVGLLAWILVAIIGELRWFQLLFLLSLWAPISHFVSTIVGIGGRADRPEKAPAQENQG